MIKHLKYLKIKYLVKISHLKNSNNDIGDSRKSNPNPCGGGSNLPSDLHKEFAKIINANHVPTITGNKMTEERWSTVNKAFTTMYEKSGLFRMLVKALELKGVKIKMEWDNNIKSTAKASRPNWITFSDKYSEDMTVNFTHELFHIFQYNCGEAIYNNDPNNPNNSNEGKINREFEAYFFTDLIDSFYPRLDKTGSPFGFSQHTFSGAKSTEYDRDVFYDWIRKDVNMLNEGVQYPSNIDQDKWDSFMNDFRTKGIGKNYSSDCTTRSNQPPKALLKIIELANQPNSGCNPANGIH